MVRFQRDGAVQFDFRADVSGPVYLVGDFNGWDERAHPMKEAGGSAWSLRLNLRAGNYRFLYRADQRWYVDSDAPDVPNPWGSEFSIVTVPESAPQ